MARTQGKTGLIVTIGVLVIALLIFGVIALAKNAQKTTPAPSTDTSKQVPGTTKDATSTETDATDTPAKDSSTVPVADPSTLSSIDVAPLGMTVFYTKGIPGFDFAVKKTADKTQFAEFSSSDLVGTKCTDDVGLFATIIKNPSSNEDQATISQTVKLGSDTYGLSLAGKGCTSDASLLDQYQTAFKNGFSSLKSL